MANLSLLISLLLVLPLLVQSGSTVGFYNVNNHYYKIVTSTTPITSVTAATNLANAQWLNGKQGYLATINDAGESNYVAGYVASQLTASSSVTTAWLGARKSGTSWYWFALDRLSNAFYVQGTGCYSNQYCNWNVDPATAASCAQSYLPSTSPASPAAGKWVGVDCSNAPTFTILVEFDTPSTTTCDAGFSFVAGSCRDINECTATPGICGAGYTCQNTIGYYRCNDIDECLASPNPCPSGQTCSNTPGSFTCATPSNTFFIQSLLNGLVIDLTSTAPGADLVMRPGSTSSQTQQWSLTSEGVFINAQNQLAMDIKGADSSVDTPVVTWYPKTSGDNLNQRWSYDTATKIIRSLFAADRVLDIYQVNSATGATLCIWNAKTEDILNQQWNLTSTLQTFQPATTV